MHMQVLRFDEQLRPHAVEQFVLSDQLPAAFDQCHQQVEGTWAYIHRLPICQQAALTRL